jgi:RPAP1-like, N-terminal
MKASVFIGEVTERIAEKPREMTAMKKVNLSSPAPNWKGKSLGSHAISQRPEFPIADAGLLPRAPSLPGSGEMQNNLMPGVDVDENTKKIQQMSKNDLQEAQNEIAAMFKPENLAFLQKMAMKGKKEKVGTDTSIPTNNVAVLAPGDLESFDPNMKVKIADSYSVMELQSRILIEHVTDCVMSTDII